jgi:hypothetical protein
MLGIEEGQLVLRDRTKGSETILATHLVRLEGSGSFWPQISPDGTRVIYRVNDAQINHFMVSTDGGAPRRLPVATTFNLATDWSRDGKRVIGECFPLEDGICDLIPEENRIRSVARDPNRSQLLYPSFSWDGRWIVFMSRAAARTRIAMVPVGDDGVAAGADRWVMVPLEDADGGRPRFSPDGASLYFYLTTGSVTTLVRQSLDPVTKAPRGNPVKLASVLSVPNSIFNIGMQPVITVTRDRLFFNTVEMRSNLWMTPATP